MPQLTFKRLYHELISDAYAATNNELIAQLNAIVTKDIDQITASFYTVLSNHSETKNFLTTEQVENHLKHTMRAWIEDIFTPKPEHCCNQYIQRQTTVGLVHARIKIPMTLVSFGMDILKAEFSLRIAQSQLEAANKHQALIQMNRLLDLASMIINEVYLCNIIENEKNAQTLKLHYISHDLAIECEQSRSALLHWFRELVTTLYSSKTTLRRLSVVSIYQSTFGLWVTHRAPLYFHEQKEVGIFNTYLSDIDNKTKKIIAHHKAKNRAQLSEDITELSALIMKADWQLERLSREIVSIEKNKDTLTRLMTRRYIPTVMQHEISFCLNNQSQFAVFMIDIDHFKSINDTYGHTTGDLILSEIAHLLASAIRVSDHLFRYGGEEFLMLITDVNIETATKVADNLRSLIEKHDFSAARTIKSAVTISIGISVFDGHPDYEKLITKADKALYIAKNKGRNRVEAIFE